MAERYGFSEFITIEDCYESLLKRVGWIELTFVSGKGKHKTQLQRDIEIIEAYISRRNEYYSHLGKCGKRNSYSKTDKVAISSQRTTR